MQELLLAFPMFWIFGESHFKHFENLQYFSNFCQINKKFQNSRNLISLELIMKWIDIILEVYLLRKWFSENGIQVIFIMHFDNKFNMFMRLDPLKNFSSRALLHDGYCGSYSRNTMSGILVNQWWRKTTRSS